MAAIQKGDVIELNYAGYIADTNELFDTNIEKVAKEHKKYDKDHKYEPITIVVGERQVLSGLDDDIIGKEINKEYTITLDPEDAFGKRDPKLIKTVPLDLFKKQKINPYPGMILTFESGRGAKILSVGSGRVRIDYNHPLAGKRIKYIYTILRKVGENDKKIIGILKTLTGIELKSDQYVYHDNTLIIDKKIESLKKIIEEIINKYVKNIKVEVKELEKVNKNDN